MARIPGVAPSEAGLVTRFLYWMTKRKLRRVVAPMKITAHHTRLLVGMCEMEMAQAAAHSVEESLKALAGIKTAALIGCPF
jgi:hypothetical protein